MADIRELVILDAWAAPALPETGVKLRLAQARTMLRRMVVRSSRLPFMRPLYLAVYLFHIWLAKFLASRFEGTRTVYLAAGLGRGEVRPGISDVDIIVLGDWTDNQQFRVLKRLALVYILLPLYDRENLREIQTWEGFQHLNATDLFIAYHYASARRNWKLLWGEDLVAGLAPLAPERRGGAALLETGRWWAAFMRLTLGHTAISRDEVFRNSLCFKTVADTVRAEYIARGEAPPPNRLALLQSNLGEDAALLRDRLLASEASTFLTMEGDPLELISPWLLRRLEQQRALLQDSPGLTATVSFRIEGTADERLIADSTLQHAQKVATSASQLPGFQAAYLSHCALFLMPDALALFLAFDPARVPTATQLRELMQDHLRVSPTLPQRLVIYLLLEHGAYSLDPVYGLELWTWSLMPQVNPDIFAMLTQPDFLLLGSPRISAGEPRWSSVSQELMDEELAARRGAHARFGVVSRPAAMDNIRNLLRLLQLVLMEQSGRSGELILPVTVPVICRSFAVYAPELTADLQQLEQAAREGVAGRMIQADVPLQRIYSWLEAASLAPKTLPITRTTGQ